MRGPNRIDDILERLKDIWKAYPDLRLGQLIMNVAMIRFYIILKMKNCSRRWKRYILKSFTNRTDNGN